MNNHSDALDLCNEKLVALRDILGEDHRIIAKIHMFIGDYCTDDKEQWLHEYRQALVILEKRSSDNIKLINDCQHKMHTIINST